MVYAPVNVSNLNKEEFKKFLDSFDHVFSDCDGVIWTRTALPRVGEFFKLMKDHGKSVNFVSNNSLRDKNNYEERFREAGIENGFENLTVPSLAIMEYLKSVNFSKTVYSVSCPETTRILKLHGFDCKEGPEVSPAYYEEHYQYLDDDDTIGAVVFDSDFQVNLPKLNKAVAYLRKPDVLFLAGASDTTVYSGKGTMLATGAFMKIVAEHTNREPIMLSKPGKAFGELAMRRAGVTDPSRVLFIGDMLEQDVGLGKATGFKTLLVLSHLSKETMLAQDALRPDYYAKSLASIVPLL